MKKLSIVAILLFFGATSIAQTLTLNACKELALENNKRLKESQLKLEASGKVRKNAFTKYFPTVSASAFAFKSSKNFLDIKTDAMDLPVYDGNPAHLETATQFAYVPPINIQTLDYANTAMVTAVQPLYAGGRIRTGNKLAEVNEDVTQYQYNLTKSEILVTTEDYYWNLVALNEKTITLRNYEKLLKELLKEVGDFYDAGLVKKSDLLKVQLELNKVEGNKLKLNNGIDILKMTFSQHLGIPYTENFNVIDSITTILPPQNYYTETDLALKNREEYKMLNKAVETEELQKKMTNGELLPQLAVGVGGMYLDMIDQDNTYGLVFATLSIPISDWWGGTYKKQEHEIKMEIAKNSLKQNSELLQLQMSKAYRDLTESYKQIDIAQTSVSQAVEHQKEMENNYDAGLTSLSDLLEARAIAQEAKDALIDAKAKYKINIANYLKSIGEKR
ncbi:TolC family protein [Flavobacterium sp. CS20]|uniref:TolC family protein n=1 Tax=Flavobacterium sp. CS20 TaxID=2775246 RepID=UPI001B3A5CE3|nr:TolC family protein [Flavobacterium sp. CS20]QTY27153.1 TolC family protein [Flavobacterium sp. CS20]